MHTIEEDEWGALIRFPFDRDAIAALKAAFPKIRWNPTRQGWHLPGQRASRRLSEWAARTQLPGPHDDDRGRDAFAFEPIVSRYLFAAEDSLIVRTPFDPLIVASLRELAASAWSPSAAGWTVPYRCYEELLTIWPKLERLAKAAEPEARAGAKERARAAASIRAMEARKLRVMVPVGMEPPPSMLFTPLGGPRRIAVLESVSDPIDLESCKGIERSAFVGPECRIVILVRYRIATQADLDELPCAPCPVSRSAGWQTPHQLDLFERRRQLAVKAVKRSVPQA